MDTDEQQIRQLIDRWHSASAAGDLQTVLTLMADDAIFLTPGQQPMNKDAFAAAFRAFSGRVRLESASDIKEIHTAGDLGYCWLHISVVMTSRDRATQSARGSRPHRAAQVTKRSVGAFTRRESDDTERVQRRLIVALIRRRLPRLPKYRAPVAPR